MRAMQKLVGLALGTSLLLAASLAVHADDAQKSNEAYSKDLWTALDKKGLVGASAKPAAPKASADPHGPAASTTVSQVTVGDHTGKVAIQHVYGDEGTSVDDVTKDPSKHLKAVNVMVKRKPGHDPDNGDWMWVAYDPSGKMTVPDGAKPVGSTGSPCSDCHAQQKGQDFLYHSQ